MKTIQDEILLVIPYIKSTQGRELELSLTGWRKYCTSPLRIIVIGEYDPCIEGKAEFIEAPRAEKISGQYMPNIDVARKLDMIYERFHNEYDHFVLANDDEYPVRPFDWSFLTQVTYLQTSFIGNLSAPTNYWSHDMGKTRVILDKLSKPHVNYCNHHPFYFDMETFHKMSQGFDLANNSLIRENLYYNIYHNGTAKNVNDIRYGFWDAKMTKENFRKNISNKNIVFMCNSVAGWSEELMNMLDEHYNGVGRFINNVPIKKQNSEYPFGVSVCISAWKTSEYIEECLDSVTNQTWFKDHDNWEILLGIDACKETLKKVKEIMHKYKNLRVFMMKENAGTYVTCNTIMKEAKYKWLLRFDSDDIMNPELVQTVLDNSKDADMVLWKMKNFGSISNGIDVQNTYGHHLINHIVFDSVNGYKNWVCSADDDLIHRLSNFYKVKRLDNILMKRRLHNNSLTVQDRTNFKSEIRKRYIEIVNNPDTYSTKEKCINDRYSIGEFNIVVDDKIIITFTSWKKRIHLCAHTVDLMLNQTIKPYKIVLNLSTDEFPKKENELPKDLVNKQNEIFEIYWVKENTKAYKKNMPTLDRFPNDIIISIDDDIEYPNNLIESLYQKFIEIGKNCPVTLGRRSCKWPNNIYTQHGADTLFKKEFFGDYYKELYDNVISKNKKEFVFDDLIYTYSVLLNGKRYFHDTKIDMTNYIHDSKRKSIDPISNSSNNYIHHLNNQHKAIREYIQKVYHKSYNDLFEAPIYVSITTWTKRDKFLPVMLKSIQNQTLKPDKIILWLSEEEYDKNNIPTHIQECLDTGKLSEIQWVKRNTKGFKRYNSMKIYPYAYNILLDDDIEYDKDFIKDLYEESVKYQDCITVYSGYKANYEGTKVTFSNPTREPSHTNTFIAGRCCIPPYVCPLEAINDNEDLIKYSNDCDESRFKPYLVKHDVKIHVMKKWENSHYKQIDGSQENSLYSILKEESNGIRNKERCLFNSIKVTNTEKYYKEIWPNIIF